jgi:hypothetical protein
VRRPVAFQSQEAFEVRQHTVQLRAELLPQHGQIEPPTSCAAGAGNGCRKPTLTSGSCSAGLACASLGGPGFLRGSWRCRGAVLPSCSCRSKLGRGHLVADSGGHALTVRVSRVPRQLATLDHLAVLVSR